TRLSHAPTLLSSFARRRRIGPRIAPQQRDESALAVPPSLPAPEGLLAPDLEMLPLAAADRDDEHAGLAELRAQRLGYAWRGRGDEHPIIGCELLPSERAVAVAQDDVAEPQGLETLVGGAQQRGDAFHAVHPVGESREQRRLVPGAGADLEHAVVGR